MAVNDKPPESVETRKPYWPVAAGLLGVIVLLVVGGFLFAEHSRGNTRAAGTPAFSASGSPVAFTAAIAAASSSAAPSPSSAGVNSAPTSANASAVPSSSASNSPLAQEVTAAYEHYWQVYSDAMYRLDASQVSQVASGEELKEIQDEVNSFRQRNKAVHVLVEHHYFVFDITATQAKVYDEVHNKSFLIDPVTKQPPSGPDQTDIEKDTFFFSKADGIWKVTDSTRQRGSGT